MSPLLANGNKQNISLEKPNTTFNKTTVGGILSGRTVTAVGRTTRGRRTVQESSLAYSYQEYNWTDCHKDIEAYCITYD